MNTRLVFPWIRVRYPAVLALLLAGPSPGLLVAQTGQVAGKEGEGGALRPGVDVGVAVGLAGLGGSANGAIGSARRFDSFVGYGLSSGLLVRAGVHVSRHQIEPPSFPYKLFGVYLEPRYVALGVSPGWAPWVASQLGRVWETAGRHAVRLSASGWSLGGGGGVLLRLSSQVALEAGVLYGIVRFGDYTFRGERAWYQCLDVLDDRTTLPESVLQCNGSADLAVVLCYPPFYTTTVGISGACDPPDIPHPGTARSGTWLRAWLGLSLSFATP